MPSPSPSPSPSPEERQRILVVDDNRDAADTLSMLLEFLHYEVRTAYDGRQAVEAAESFKPQLVILDINMPVMDGYEAARILRGRTNAPRVVLVALTAATSQDAQKRAREAGFDLHLAKPVDGGELTGLIERMLH